MECLKSNLTNEISYPLKEIDEQDRRTMLMNNIERGRHKSALEVENFPSITKLIKQYLELGYGIPLTVYSIKHIPGA